MYPASMSDTQQRHKHVVNLDEAKGMENLTGTRFGFATKALSEPAGGRSIGGSWWEVPPGRSAFPYHFHCVNEEAMFVLEGEGALRIGPDTVPIRAGDWVSFPIGPETAHQVTNTGSTPLRFIGLSTKVNGDVVGYPDSKKIGVRGVAPGSRFGDPPWVRIIVREGTGVDYFDGEKIE
jgi:uncharacterized cupin superfamily protein